MAPYLRFTPSNPRMIVKPRLAVPVALGLLACGGGSRTPAPQSLPETLAQFMSAVKANDAKRMGTLWGTERGPAAEWMKSDELQQLLRGVQQDPGRRPRMEEGDAAACGAAARYLVHETVARRAAALQRQVEIGHAVADVVYARAAAREKLRHGAIGIAGLEQLDLNVAQREADDRSAVGRLGSPRREAEDVTIEGQGGRDAGHGDADVGDAGSGVRHLARQHNECTRGSGGSW